MIIDREIRPLKIINEARTCKPTLVISYMELAFTLGQPALSVMDKLVWVLVVTLSAKEPELVIVANYQEMADFLTLSPLAVKQSILRLSTMGFIKPLASNEGEMRGRLSYPIEGLLEIKKSPKVIVDEGIKRLFRGIPNRRPLSINLLLDYPVSRVPKKQLLLKPKETTGIQIATLSQKTAFYVPNAMIKTKNIARIVIDILNWVGGFRTRVWRTFFRTLGA